MRRVVNALAQAGHTMGDIGGVLITHEHSDHISGLKMLVKHHHLPVFAPGTVAARLLGAVPELAGSVNIIPVNQRFEIGSLAVTAFPTPHDTDQSVGYRVSGGAVFALATDMGVVTEQVEAALTGADAVLIESNHDEDMLRYGPYPVYLKRRILSERGHLSNESCAALAARLAGSGTKKIILGHLSRENNRPELALAERAVKGAAALYCAPPLGFLRLPVGKAEPCFA